MAKTNPTGSGSAVALTISPEQARLLRPILEMVRDGIREELQSHADTLREPARLRREEEALVSLLAALDGGSVIPDPESMAVLGELAASIDAANEYARVVAEHDALHGLLALLDSSPGGQS